MMKLSTIVPTNMSQDELRFLVANLATSINWNLKNTTVNLENGMQYRVSVDDIEDYREELQTQSGRVRV